MTRKRSATKAQLEAAQAQVAFWERQEARHALATGRIETLREGLARAGEALDAEFDRHVR